MKNNTDETKALPKVINSMNERSICSGFKWHIEFEQHLHLFLFLLIREAKLIRHFICDKYINELIEPREQKTEIR